MAWHLEELDEKVFLVRSGQQLERDEIFKIEAGKFIGKLEVRRLILCFFIELSKYSGQNII